MSDSEDTELNFEAEEELGDLGAAQAKLKKLKDELAKVKEERQQYLDGWQRCKADSVNARKEALAAADRTAERTLESFITELLPALDGFDMARGSEAWASIDDGWRSGVEHINNSLLEVLKNHGIERYGKIGEKFDPRLHEAVQEIEDVAGEPHSIVRILRYGYRMGERVLRAAQVILKA